MDPLLLKAYESLVPIDQEIIAGLILRMAGKDERISYFTRRLGEVFDNSQKDPPA